MPDGLEIIKAAIDDFKKIQVLYDNEEYSIVQSGTTYGLSVYDYIALDASSVQEHDFTHE